MSLLYKNLRIHQIFGANTDVGKTVLSSALVRASAARGNTVLYLKPVSTGPVQDADDEHVIRFAGSNKHLVRTDCTFRYREPVSPHLAAKLTIQDEANIPSDRTFINSIASYIRRCASSSLNNAHMYIETAGGVHSPTLSGTTQADSYRPLLLPTILIGDAKLGGISSTISSYESLVLRGYTIDTILLFRDEYYRNWEYLSSYFEERGIHVKAVNPPPQRLATRDEDTTSMERYYDQIVPVDKTSELHTVIDHLNDCHSLRIQDLHSLPRRTLDTVWWPFVQHGLVKGEKDVTVIDSATSDFFSVYNGHSSTPPSKPNQESLLEPQLDGSASWWTQALGHGQPELTLTAANAAGRYGHVMFPQATHEPALRLAERLVHRGPGKGWASRAFFSDDGSTGMEIALKMALRAYSVHRKNTLDVHQRKNLGVLGLKGGYHGDTIGSMDACEEGVYTCEWHNAKGFWFDPPSVFIRQGRAYISLPSALSVGMASPEVPANNLSWIYNITTRLQTPLADTYRTFIECTLEKLRSQGPELAALVLEPLVMGAGGMIFVDPLFQRIMVDVVRSKDQVPGSWSGLPVIFDEVFVGLHRIGMETTGPLLGINPDISVNAKILTGGLVPLAVTLTSESIFNAFLSESKTDALLHGHSYTAHVVGCAVANKTLDIVERVIDSKPWREARERWTTSASTAEKDGVFSLWDPHFVHTISMMRTVNEVMTLGTVLAIKFKDQQGGYASQSAQTLLQSIVSRVEDENVLSSAPGGSSFGIHFRTLGNVAYFMTSLNTEAETIRSVENRIWAALAQNKKV